MTDTKTKDNMRTISEQELKDILDKHDKWLRDEGGERANLRYADLSYADLRDANLRYADLRDANLRDADLRDANLRDANLRYADLRDANLRYADLRDANLRDADLRDANLSYANLSYANLIVFQYRKHWAFYTLDGSLRIGCLVMPIYEWEIGFKEIGQKHYYSSEEIMMYGNFIKSCVELFKLQTAKGETNGK
jgi:hypothetical protein